MEISVAGSTFIGQLLSFGILIVAIETKVVVRKLERWMLLGLASVLLVTVLSVVSLLVVFHSINYDEPIVGHLAWVTVVVCIALYLAVLGSVVSSVIVRYTDADRAARQQELLERTHRPPS